jgi:LPXTG-motif cell wall-anchored protein
MKDEIDAGLLTLGGLALASAGLIYWMKKKKKKKRECKLNCAILI